MGNGASKSLVDYGKNVIILVNIEIRIIYHDYSLTLKKNLSQTIQLKSKIKNWVKGIKNT